MIRDAGVRTFFVGAVALLGAAVGGIYSVNLMRVFADPASDAAVRQVVISAIAGQAGWTALMIWVLAKPLRRYEILLFMTVPVVLANLLHSADAYLRSGAGAGELVANTLSGLLVAAVFVSAFIVGRSGAAHAAAGRAP